MVGDDVEGEDQVARVVVAGDHVADVDVEPPALDGVEGDRDVADVDPWLPPLQRLPDVVGDLAGRGAVRRAEHVVVDPAAELRAHRPLPASGAEDDADGLLDLPLPDDQGDRRRWRRWWVGTPSRHR